MTPIIPNGFFKFIFNKHITRLKKTKRKKRNSIDTKTVGKPLNTGFPDHKDKVPVFISNEIVSINNKEIMSTKFIRRILDNALRRQFNLFVIDFGSVRILISPIISNHAKGSKKHSSLILFVCSKTRLKSPGCECV